MKKGKRNSQPNVQVLPRCPKLCFVVESILIGSVSGQNVRDTGSAHGCLKTCVSCDRIIGQHPAVTPSSNPQTIRICDALKDDMIDRGQNILHILISPVCVDALSEGFSMA